MDVAEPACGNGDVLSRYLDMVVDLGPLAVQAFPVPGSDVLGEVSPDLPGRHEAAGCPHTGVGSPV